MIILMSRCTPSNQPSPTFQTSGRTVCNRTIVIATNSSFPSIACALQPSRRVPAIVAHHNCRLSIQSCDERRRPTHMPVLPPRFRPLPSANARPPPLPPTPTTTCFTIIDSVNNSMTPTTITNAACITGIPHRPTYGHMPSGSTLS